MWAVLAVSGLTGCTDPQQPETDTPALQDAETEVAPLRVVSPSNTSLLWARQGYAPYDDERLDVVTQDRSGNVIAAGVFSGTLDFGLGRVWMGDPGDRFLVVVKYASDGQVLWNLPLRVYTPVPEGREFASWSAIATDRHGDILLAGQLDGQLEFENSLNPVSSRHFLLRLSASGNPLWVQPINADGPAGRITGLAIDAEGNIGVGGWIWGSVRFGPNNILASPHWSAAWLARLTAAGQPQWALFLPTLSGPSLGQALTVDNEQHLLFAGTLGGDPFVSRVAPSGNQLWTRRIYGANGSVTGVATHGNRVIVTGQFAGMFSVLGETFSGGDESPDSFLVAYTRDGQARWGKQLPGTSTGVGMDQLDGVVVTGTFEPPGSPRVPPENGFGSTLYVHRYERIRGDVRWKRQVGGDVITTFARPSSLHVAKASGHIVISGLFGGGPVDFGGATMTPDSAPNLPGNSRHNPFVLKLAP
jgi:hypothetical protein